MFVVSESMTDLAKIVYEYLKQNPVFPRQPFDDRHNMKLAKFCIRKWRSYTRRRPKPPDDDHRRRDLARGIADFHGDRNMRWSRQAWMHAAQAIADILENNEIAESLD